MPHFERSFKAACPQIKFYSHQDELWDKPWAAKEYIVDAHALSQKPHPKADYLMGDPENWRSLFYKWVAENVPAYSEQNPILIAFESADAAQLWRYPLSYDTNEFVATFGRLLRFREDIRRIAGTILYSMSSQHDLDLDLGVSVQPNKFYGAHLRTASDAPTNWWPGYESQAKDYFNHVEESKLSLIYLTSGSPTDAERFRETAASKGRTVVTKDILLSGEDYTSEREEMKNLRWDQLGAIDFLVLLRSSQFGGMFESSFSWNVALVRHIVANGGKWVPITEGKEGQGLREGEEEGPASFRDSLSSVFGKGHMNPIEWLFPLGEYP